MWENCGNRQFTPVVLGVASEWNQPVVQALPSSFAAELEARALVVQAVEVSGGGAWIGEEGLGGRRAVGALKGGK